MRSGALVLAVLIYPTMVQAQSQAQSQAQAQARPSGTNLQHVLAPLQTEAPSFDVPQVEHLLGDLGGARTGLENRGIYLRLGATTEFAGNVGGGLQRGATAANQIAVSADVDWQQVAGVAGLSTHMILVNRSGASTSHLFGDNVSPVQEIYGAGGNVAVHLVSAFAEQRLFGGMLDIAAGWMNVENDFASSPLYCNYMNNGLCGDPKALPGGDIGHSAFPDAVWAARVHVHPTPRTDIAFGVYEVNQDLYSNADRSGLQFGVPHDSGVYIPVQIGYQPKLGADNMPGHYVIGVGYDSSHFKSFYGVLPTPAGTPPASQSGNIQLWVLADQMLLRNGPGDQDGVIALAGYIHNDPDRSSYAEQYFAGLLDRGFWRLRPKDTVGLLLTYLRMSNTLGGVQTQQQALGIPFADGVTGVQTSEIVLEANYNIHIYRGVDLQPDFQYVVRPNAQANIHDAAVLGFKANVEF